MGRPNRKGPSLPPREIPSLPAWELSWPPVWLRDRAGERQLTSETYALLPTLAPSGDRVYYLARNAGARARRRRGALVGEPRHRAAGARAARARDGKFSLSADGRKVVFTTAEDEADRGIWIAETRSPHATAAADEKRRVSRVLRRAGGDRVSDPGVGSLPLQDEGGGSENQRISTTPVTNLISVSPDGRWAVALLPGRSKTEAERGGTRVAARRGVVSFVRR